MSSDDGDMWRAFKAAKREVRAKYGISCPKCVELLPKANPTILLPGQRCKIHGYRDPRPRMEETECLPEVQP